MRILKLVATKEQRQKWLWKIRNLPHKDGWGKLQDELALHCVGVYHSCDTPESIVEALYRELYDQHQCTNAFQDGDIIVSDKVTVNKYHSWDDKLGTVSVPALMFRVEGIHVILENVAKVS